MTRHTFFRFASLLICSLAFAALAQGQTAQRTFVSTSGSDANTASLCSAANPCRGFAAALTVTNTNGEIVALTSGGYGAVTITKGVQITAPTGIYAGITASSGDGITVNAPGAVVVLRGLTLNGQGASNGILVTAVGALHVEGCIVNGFSNNGINVNLTADGSEVFIKDTIVRNNGGGIFITTTSGTVRASINGCRSENHVNDGFLAYNRSRVTISNSVASGNGNSGFYALSDVSGATTEMNADHCVASNNPFGFVAVGGKPPDSGGTATMRVARSTATNNTDTGFAAFGISFGSAVFESLGDNLVRGNNLNIYGVTVVTGQ